MAEAEDKNFSVFALKGHVNLARGIAPGKDEPHLPARRYLHRRGNWKAEAESKPQVLIDEGRRY